MEDTPIQANNGTALKVTKKTTEKHLCGTPRYNKLQL